GVGAIAGGLTAARLIRRLGDGRVVGLGIVTFALASLALTAPTLLVVVPGIVVFGLSISWVVVAWGTAIQQRTPTRRQGRVSSAGSLVVGVPQTISIAAGAGLSALVDYRLLLVVMAAVSGAAGLYLVTRRFGPAADDVAAAELRRGPTAVEPLL